MKQTCILVLLISIIFTACNFPIPTEPADIIETDLTQYQGKNPGTTHTNLSTPQPTVIIPQPTSGSRPDQINLAKIINNLFPLFCIARVRGMAHLDNGQLLVTIEVPGGVQGDYYACVGKNFFNCSILSQYPDHLYCHGRYSQAGQYAYLRLFKQGEEKAVFEARIGIPP